MKKRTWKRVMSYLLTLVMVFGLVNVGALRVQAEAKTYTIRVSVPEEWAIDPARDIHIYIWSGETKCTGDWPGAAMTAVANSPDHIYTYDFTTELESWNMIIFYKNYTGNSSTYQRKTYEIEDVTPDSIKNGIYYIINDGEMKHDLGAMFYSTYLQHDEPPTDDMLGDTTAYVDGALYIRVPNTNAWENVYIYLWNNQGQKPKDGNGDDINYPGSLLTSPTAEAGGTKLYKVKRLPEGFTNMIINNGTNDRKTADLHGVKVREDKYLLYNIMETEGKVSGVKKIEFSRLEEDMLTLTDSSYVYTGSEISPTVTVTDGGVLVDPDAGLYSITDDSVPLATNVGTYTVTVQGDGIHYIGNASKTWTITPKPLTSGMISFSNGTDTDGSFVYNGGAITPTVVVKDGTTVLSSPTSYSVVTEDSTLTGTNVGSYTVKVQGAGNYTGTITKTWAITPKQLTSGMISFENETDTDGSFVYNGGAITPTVVVKDGTTVLSAPASYSIVAADSALTGTNVGTYTVKVEGTGNYTGTPSNSWAITAKPLTITAIDQSIYNNGQITSSVDQVTATGLVAGDTLTGITLTGDASAGTITPSSAATTKGAANYSITYVHGALHTLNHEHAWHYAAQGNQIKAYCTSSQGTCTHYGESNAVMLTLSAEGGEYTGDAYAATVADGIYHVTGQAHEAVAYYPAAAAGSTEHAGAALAGAPAAAGNYVAEVSLGGATAKKAFSITKKPVASVAVTGLTLPQKGGAFDTELTCGTEGVAGISSVTYALKSGGAAGATASSNTEYVMTAVLQADGNHAFSDTVAATVDGHHAASCTKNADGTITVTYEFKTAPAILSVTAPQPVTLSGDYANADDAAHAAQLPDQITVVVEDGNGTKEIQVEASWSVASYDSLPEKVNTFTWSFDPADEKLQGYVTAGLPAEYYTGTTAVTNRPRDVLDITAYNRTVVYAGAPIAVDMGSLFTIPDGLGSPAYTLTAGEGTLSADNKLTVNEAGEFTFRVVTQETAYHHSQSAIAHLMVEKGAGSGSVQVEAQYELGTAIAPVAASATNGTDHVIVEYKGQGDPDDYYDTEPPTAEGAYTVRATFPATALYHGCQAEQNFRIVMVDVQITPHNRSVSFSGETFDLNTLFEFGTGCGEKTFTIVAEPMDSGLIEGDRLTFTNIGDYRIHVATAENGKYRAGAQEAVLTVTARQISAVDLTDFMVPKKGDAFDTGLACQTEGVDGEPQVSYTQKDGTAAGEHAASNTEYVMKAVLKADANYAFAEGIAATVDGEAAEAVKNADGTLTVTYRFKTLPAIIRVKAPEPVTFSGDYKNGEQAVQSAELPERAAVEVETAGGTKEIEVPVVWSVAEYNPLPDQTNTFVWNFDPSVEELAGYDASGLPEDYHTGTILVANHPKGVLGITAFNRSVDYAGKLISIDELDLFEIPEELGNAVYSLTQGKGQLSGDHKLTVREAGEFTFQAETAETAHYHAQTAVAHLIVRKGIGSGTVQVEDQYTVGADIAPVAASETNPGEAVLEYRKQAEPDSAYAAECPKEIGEYTVRATFPESALYHECQAVKNFKIVPKNENAFVTPLTMENWVYGETPAVPAAAAKYGEVSFQYSDRKDGTYSGTQPAQAGTWFVKALVAEGDTYKGLESEPVSYEIKKAVPVSPAGLEAVNASTQTASDGMIRGVSDQMEYRKAGTDAFVPVTGDTVKDLAAGSYEVRYAEDANHQASPVTAVTIGVGEADTTEAAGGTTEAANGTTEAAGDTTEEASGDTTEAAGDTTEAAGGTTEAAGGTTEAAGGTTEAAGGTTEAAGGTTEAAGGTTETAGGTTEAAGGMTEAAGGTTEAAGGTTEAAGGTTEAAGGTTEAAGGTTEAAGGTTEAAGGTTEAAGGTTEAAGGTTEAAGGSVSEEPAGKTTEKNTGSQSPVAQKTEEKTTAAQDAANDTEETTTEEPPKTKQEIKRDYDLALNENLKVSQRAQEIYVRWGQVDEADGYDVYAAYCGTDFNPKKPAKSAKGMKVTSVKITSLEGKKLDRKRNYKLYVTAYKWVKGKKVVIAESIRAHIVGAMNTRYTNVRHIKLQKNKFTLKVGQKVRIRAKAVLVNKHRKQLSSAHAPQFRYISSYERVATVNAKGRIKAVGRGTCTVYVYARNGYARKVKVTVK